MTEEMDWVREAMRQFGEQLHDIRRDVSDVRERMIKLESDALHKTVDTLQAQLGTALSRLDALEAQHTHSQGVVHGVGKTADWLYKLAPWIFATALVVVSNWQKFTG